MKSLMLIIIILEIVLICGKAVKTVKLIREELSKMLYSCDASKYELIAEVKIGYRNLEQRTIL